MAIVEMFNNDITGTNPNSWITISLRLIAGVGFEVLTPVVTKRCSSWDITPYSSVKVNRLFRGTYPSSGFRRKLSKKPELSWQQAEVHWKVRLERLYKIFLHTMVLHFNILSCSNTGTDLQKYCRILVDVQIQLSSVTSSNPDLSKCRAFP
jgi:hypothetical protein